MSRVLYLFPKNHFLSRWEIYRNLCPASYIRDTINVILSIDSKLRLQFYLHISHHNNAHKINNWWTDQNQDLFWLDVIQINDPCWKATDKIEFTKKKLISYSQYYPKRRKPTHLFRKQRQARNKKDTFWRDHQVLITKTKLIPIHTTMLYI